MAAQQDRNRHALEVTVCKQVRDRGHDHDHDRNRRFDIQVRTDRDSTDFRLRDHECRSISLDFRRNSFSLEESRNRGDSVDFRVHGDVERSGAIGLAQVAAGEHRYAGRPGARLLPRDGGLIHSAALPRD